MSVSEDKHIKQRLIDCLDGQDTDRAPFVCPMQTATIDLMKKCGCFWPDAHKDAGKMALLAISAHEFGGLEAARVPFENTIEVSAFGAETAHRTLMRQPLVLGQVVTDHGDLEALEVPDPLSSDHCLVVLDALKQMEKARPDLPLICGIVSPAALAFQMLGEQDALMDVKKDPSLLLGAINKAEEFCADYARAVVGAGADIVAVVDHVSNCNLLTREEFERLSLPSMKRALISARRAGAHTILHLCGDTGGLLELLVGSGAQGISVDHHVPVEKLVLAAKGRVATIGNLDPNRTLRFGHPQDVEAESIKAVEGGISILSPGCGFAIETPLQNMCAMAKAAQTHPRLNITWRDVGNVRSDY
jgi:[methyl-Co(III) methanol-specific corrinoid protein]:coenzyme M methyltransferase